MKDFEPTTVTDALTGQDPVWISQRARLWWGLCAFLAPGVLALLAFLGYYVYDRTSPVITEFVVKTQWTTDRGTVIEGVMNKVRDCELVEVVARTHQREVTRVDFADLGDRPAYSRPLGPQKFGPWIVWASPGDGVAIYARHRCNRLFEHTAEIGVFVVGQ